MSNRPQLSVVIPAYNQPELLRETVDSVLAQDCDDFELIVVDDGSPQELKSSVEHASKQLGDRFQFVCQENAGGSAARNTGVALARAPWVSLLDHDDLWQPQRVRRQLEVIAEQPQAAFHYCQYLAFGEGAKPRIVPEQGASGEVLVKLLHSTLIRTLSVVTIRRDALGSTPWFDGRYKYANDIDLYYRLAQQHQAYFLPEVLVKKRSHPEQASLNLYAAHSESVAIVRALVDRLGDEVTPALQERIHWRIRRHLLGAAKSAAADGKRTVSRRYYSELLSMGRWNLRAWRGWLQSLL